jgi:hypothetical protein
MTDPLYPGDATAEIDDPQLLTYDVQLPWLFTNASRCRSCRAPVGWAEHEHTGRKAPFNPDGTSHFSTCPDSDHWRRR